MSRKIKSNTRTRRTNRKAAADSLRDRVHHEFAQAASAEETAAVDEAFDDAAEAPRMSGVPNMSEFGIGAKVFVANSGGVELLAGVVTGIHFKPDGYTYSVFTKRGQWDSDPAHTSARGDDARQSFAGEDEVMAKIKAARA